MSRTFALAVAVVAACTGQAPPDVTTTTSPPDDTPPTVDPGTQVGEEGTDTGQDCAFDPLATTDVLASGVTVGDVLALLPPATRVTPIWFDGRAVDLDVEARWDGAPILGDVDWGCSTRTGLAASVVSVDGAVAEAAVVTAGLYDAPSVHLAWEIPEAAWAGSIDPASLHASPCDRGEFEVRMSFEAATWEGVVRHRCEVDLARRTAGTATTPWDTGGADPDPDPTTDTDTDTDGATTDTETDGGPGGTSTGTIPADYDVFYVDIATWTVQR